MLKSEDTNALEFLNEVKMNLDLKEVVIFTPKETENCFPKEVRFLTLHIHSILLSEINVLVLR